MTRFLPFRRMAAGLLLTLPLFLGTGCGDSSGRAGVQGTVTLNGSPVDGGRIMFIAQEKGVNAHADIIDGHYSLEPGKGPSTGPCHVEIVWYKKTGKKIPGSDPPNLVDEKVQLIPEEYNARSTMEVEVKPGMNTFDYELKAPKGPQSRS